MARKSRVSTNQKQIQAGAQDRRNRRDTAAQIDEVLNDQTSLEIRPRFRKPIAFLETLTPLLEVTLELPVVEPVTAEVDFERFDLFSIPYNNIESFEYKTLTGEITFSMVDVEYSLLEGLLMRFELLKRSGRNLPYANIRFGWATDERLESKAEFFNRGGNKDVFFEHSVRGRLLDAKLEYVEEGYIKATFEFNEETEGLPNKYRELMPYNVLSSAPIISLALARLIGIDIVTAPEETRRAYFRSVSQTVHSLKQRKAPESARIMQLIAQLSPAFRNLQGLVGDPASRSELVKLKDGSTTQSEFGKAISTRQTAEELAAFNQGTFESKNVKDSWEEFRIAIQDIRGLFNRGTNEASARELENKLLPLLYEFRIHPIDCYNFLIDTLRSQIESNPNIKNTVTLVEIKLFDERRLLGRGTDNLFDQTDFNLKAGLNGPDAFLKLPAKKIAVSATDTWNTVLSKITGEMRVGVPEGSEVDAGAKKISDLTAKDAGGKTVKIGTRTINSAGQKISEYQTVKLNIFVAGADAAKTNISAIRTMFADDLAANTASAESAREQLNNAEQAAKDGKDVFFVILSELASDSIFNSAVGGQKIVNAYSYRFQSDDSDTSKFNPAIDREGAALDINWPDVISWAPDLSYLSSISSWNFTNNLKAEVNQGNSTTEGQQISAKETLQDDQTEQQVNKDTGKKVLDEKLKKVPPGEQQTFLLDQQEKSAELIQKTLEDAAFRSEVSRDYPVRAPLAFDKSQVFFPGASNIDSQNAKRSLENFRRRLIIDGSSITGTLTILGDPSYSRHTNGAYLYLKVYNPDGTLSYNTGVYNIIGDATHSISAGQFTTTIELKKDITNERFKRDMLESFNNRDQFIVEDVLQVLCDDQLRSTISEKAKVNAEVEERLGL